MTSRIPAHLPRSAMLSALLLSSAFDVAANPTGGVVTSGTATITTAGNTVTVVNSPGAVITWQGFSIGAGQVTNFVQPSPSSTVLNRVVGQSPSAIAGSLQSNGRVFLINPNGALFSGGAQINTASFTFSTNNVSDAELAANNTVTAGSGSLLNVGGAFSIGGAGLTITPSSVDLPGSIDTGTASLTIMTGGSFNLSGIITAPPVTTLPLITASLTSTPVDLVTNTPASLTIDRSNITTLPVVRIGSGNTGLTSVGSPNGAILLAGGSAGAGGNVTQAATSGTVAPTARSASPATNAARPAAATITLQKREPLF
jgi:filamentous hemagglutinin family protein